MIEALAMEMNNDWRDVGREVLVLLDAFYRARIAQPGAGRAFAEAQEILAGDSFARVQRRLGLLQTVILYGLPVDGREPYKLEHLETTLGLTVPWLVIDPSATVGSTWQTSPHARATAIGKVFVKFREDSHYGVQEFAHILGTAGPGPRPLRPRLSKEEEDANYLLVSDEEQSFVSMLFVLFEARGHSSNGRQFLSWIDSTSPVVLRSILRQTDLDGAPPDVSAVRLLPSLWNDHYWEPSTFAGAMTALGFLSDGAPTSRFERLLVWLRTPGEHVALNTVTVQYNGHDMRLSDLVDQIGLPQIESEATPRSLASLVGRALELISFPGDAPVSGDLFKSDALRSFGLVRFNLPGEYLLRRDESISRTFFATPLGTVSLGRAGGTYAWAFALGTLLDVERSGIDVAMRLVILRQLLAGIAEFGLSHTVTETAVRLEVVRKERERARWLSHQVFSSLYLLKEAINDVVVSNPRSREEVNVRKRFARVQTMFEYVAGKTKADASWPNDLPHMLQALVDWYGAEDTRTIVLEADDDSVHYADEVARSLHIVLVNLSDNAYKCAGRGGRVTLGCRRDEVSGAATVWVENTRAVMEKPFADYLRGTSEVIPMQGGRECEGLQTVRQVLGDLGAVAPVVTAPAMQDGTGTRVSFSLPTQVLRKATQS